jgi:hypothetical protein
MPNTYNIGAVCQPYNPQFSPTVSTDVRVYAGYLMGNPSLMTITGGKSSTGNYYTYMLCTTTIQKLYNYFSGCSASTSITFPDGISSNMTNSSITDKLNLMLRTQIIIVPIQLVTSPAFSSAPNFSSSDVNALTGTIVQNWNAPLINNFTDFNANIVDDQLDANGTSAKRIMVTGTNGSALPVAPTLQVASSSDYINDGSNKLAFYNYVEIMTKPNPLIVNLGPPYTTVSSSNLTYTPNDLAYIGIPNSGTAAPGSFEVPTIDSNGNPGIAFSSQIVPNGTEYKSGYFYGFGYPSEANFATGSAGSSQIGGSAPSGFSIKYTSGSLQSFFIKDQNNNYLGYSPAGGGTWTLYNDLIQSYYSASGGSDVLFTICKDGPTSNYLAPKTVIGSISYFTIALQGTPSSPIGSSIIGAIPNGWSSCSIKIIAPSGFSATLSGGGSVTITDAMNWVATTTIGSGSITATEPYTYETLLLPGYITSPSDQAVNVLYLTTVGGTGGSTTQLPASSYPTTGTATCGMAFGPYNNGTGTGYNMFIPLNSILPASTAASSTSIISNFYLWVFVPVNSTVNPSGTNIYIISCSSTGTGSFTLTPAPNGIASWIQNQISTSVASAGSTSISVLTVLGAVEEFAWSMNTSGNMFSLQTLGSSKVQDVTANPNYFYLTYVGKNISIAQASSSSLPSVTSGSAASTMYTGFQCRYITTSGAAVQGLSLIGTPTVAGSIPSPSPSPSTSSYVYNLATGTTNFITDGTAVFVISKITLPSVGALTGNITITNYTYNASALVESVLVDTTTTFPITISTNNITITGLPVSSGGFTSYSFDNSSISSTSIKLASSKSIPSFGLTPPNNGFMAFNH